MNADIEALKRDLYNLKAEQAYNRALLDCLNAIKRCAYAAECRDAIIALSEKKK